MENPVFDFVAGVVATVVLAVLLLSIPTTSDRFAEWMYDSGRLDRMYEAKQEEISHLMDDVFEV